MLNRRILRIKAFKELFSYSGNRSMSLRDALSEFERSCESVRDLYLFVLNLIPALTAEASRRIEAARSKFSASEEERNPNLKFVENGLARLLLEDPDFQKLVEKKHLAWDNYDALLRKLYDGLLELPYYAEYMSTPGQSLAADAELFCQVFEQLLQDNEDLEKILEDLSIYWVDDLDYALNCACQLLPEVAKKGRWELPPLYRSEMLEAEGKKVDSDKQFAQRLVQGAVAGYDAYDDRVSAATSGWDRDRICAADRVLIILGLAEVEHVPEIPARVSVNEWVDIAKYYSTRRSASFVNGVLDKTISQLIEDKGIAKSLK